MKKKYLAILLATLMSATIFAGLATVSADEIPEGVEVPDTLPIEPLIDVKDENLKSRESLPDLEVSHFQIDDKLGTLHYRMKYKLYNCGDADIVYAQFTDFAWYYHSYQWREIGTSETFHSSITILAEQYSNWFYWEWYPPQGLKFVSQWTDINGDIEEMVEEDDDPTNNYKTGLFLFN